MLEASRRRVEGLDDDALVLDVGGWAKPLERADWVLDLMPYETRGLYGYDVAEAASRERFTAEQWVQVDMCDHRPWPFEDDQFDFAVCSHTLEDIRDPIWVCRELQRVARAGYIEVPDRREEQCFGVHGRWAGWSHHRWLVDVEEQSISFTGKPHFLHARQELHFPKPAWRALSAEERVQTLWWEGGFEVVERLLWSEQEARDYLAEVIPVTSPPPPASAVSGPGRLRTTLGRLLRRDGAHPPSLDR